MHAAVMRAWRYLRMMLSFLASTLCRAILAQGQLHALCSGPSGQVQLGRICWQLKEYICDTGLMFYKFGVEPTLFLDASMRSLLSDDFRGALAENSVMQALSAAGLSTYYWMPSEKVGQGEVDFVFQDRAMRVVPVEVKSGRNVKAKSLAKLIREGRSNRAYLLSENDFSKSSSRVDGCEIRKIPLYSAFCLGA